MPPRCWLAAKIRRTPPRRAAKNSLPTQAQPKLPAVKLYLGAETLDAEQALTPREQQTGMMFRTNIQDTDAMIFVFPRPFQASFWMKNCPESISAAYIDPAGVIQEIHHLEKNDTNAVVAASANIQYVLETSDGWFGDIMSTPAWSSAPRKVRCRKRISRDKARRR